jgi:hypothetical protein
MESGETKFTETNSNLQSIRIHSNINKLGDGEKISPAERGSSSSSINLNYLITNGEEDINRLVLVSGKHKIKKSINSSLLSALPENAQALRGEMFIYQ